jgi:hypothetical protein
MQEFLDAVKKIMQNHNIEPIDISTSTGAVWFKDKNTKTDMVLFFSTVPEPEDYEIDGQIPSMEEDI